VSVDNFDRLVRRAVRAEVTPERVLEAVARECEYSIEQARGCVRPTHARWPGAVRDSSTGASWSRSASAQRNLNKP